MLTRFPRFAILITVALATAVVGNAALPAFGAGEAAQLDQTRQRINEIRRNLSVAKGRASAVESQVNALQDQIDELNREIRSDEKSVSSLESDIRTAEAKLTDLEARYSRAAQASNDRARRLYTSSPIDAISHMLSAKSVAEFTRQQVFLEISSQADGKAMIESTRIKALLMEQKTYLVGVRDNLAARRLWLADRRSLIASARNDKASALSSIEAEIREELNEIRALEAQSRALTAALRGSVSRSSGTVSRAGFIWPLRGAITSPYGKRWGSFHPGIDIDGNTGDPIRASKSGNIVGVACGSGYGICTIIDHGGGVATLYAHQSRKAIGGGHVNQGDVIGYVGCTGSCTGSHLHFEVRVDGSPRNPREFLP